MERIIYFDLETKYSAEEVGGWENIEDMGMSVGVIWDSVDQQFSVTLIIRPMNWWNIVSARIKSLVSIMLVSITGFWLEPVMLKLKCDQDFIPNLLA